MTSAFNRKSKASKDEDNSEITLQDVSKEAESLIEKVIGDVGKTSATQQLVLGTASGWLTGYLMMKVGKAAAVAVGGGIILLQVANHKGYVNVNWDRIYKNVEEQVGKMEGTSSNKGQKIFNKVEKFVDRKLDKAEALLKKKERKAKRWFNRVTDNEDGVVFEPIHVFIASFIAGMTIGIISGKIL